MAAGSITLSILSSRDEGSVISPFELLNSFLTGIKLVQKDGTPISKDIQKITIQSAQSLIEKTLGIKIMLQVVSETRNYYLDDFQNWLYLRTTFPINYGIDLTGSLVNQLQISYPNDWICVKKSSTKQYNRNFSLVPNGGNSAQTYTGVLYNGFWPYSFRFGVVPNYWMITYITGFAPSDIDSLILSAICKVASIDLLNIASNFIIGPGLTGTSLGLDGLNQSIQTAKSSSSSAFAPMIIQYISDLKNNIIPQLKRYYKGVNMVSA